MNTSKRILAIIGISIVLFIGPTKAETPTDEAALSCTEDRSACTPFQLELRDEEVV